MRERRWAILSLQRRTSPAWQPAASATSVAPNLTYGAALMGACRGDFAAGTSEREIVVLVLESAREILEL